MAGIPIVGPALAIAAASAISIALAVHQARAKKKQKLASGSLIRGGIPGRDSVDASLMPGEKVLSVEETKAYDEMMKEQRLGRQANGQMAGPIVVQFASPVPGVSKSETQRWLQQALVPAMKELHRNGHLGFMGAT